MPGSMMQPDIGAVMTGEGVRADALARWQQDGWPGPRVESWRFTRIDSLAERDLVPATGLTGAAGGPGVAAAAGIAAHVIRFENGILDESGLADLP
ncbi:MAG: hypothetical protein CBC19_04345, partial [Oceanospirillales bacterium TMED59]